MSLVQFRPEAPPYADLAHLVERRLAKAKVAGSSPVIRSKAKARQTAFGGLLLWKDPMGEKLSASCRRQLAALCKAQSGVLSPVICSITGSITLNKKSLVFKDFFAV